MSFGPKSVGHKRHHITISNIKCQKRQRSKKNNITCTNNNILHNYITIELYFIYFKIFKIFNHQYKVKL